MRLSGLASGMDTDMMVKEMMKAERMKVDRVEQKKQTTLWRQESYNNMNKLIANFILSSRKELGLNKTSSTGLITTNSYKNLDYVKKASSSKETVATISSTSSGSINGSFEIEVVELAKQDRVSVKLDKDEKFDINIKINGVEIESKGKTSKEVAKLINANKDLKEENAGAFYDELTGRLFINSDHNGGTGIEVEGLTNDTLKSEVGNYAKIKINGELVEGKNIKNNTIDFNGMKIDFKDIGTTTIKVESNVDGMMEKIQKFVEDYNAMMDAIALSTTEKRYPSYKPLSQEEKKAMTEADVKLWEEKAKSGMLNKDESLNRLTQNVRIDLYKKVEGLEGNYKSIVDIGITTEKYAKGASGGKLQINEEKLRAALEENPEGVMELLFSDDKSPKPSKVNKPKDLGENPTDEQKAKYQADMKKYEDYEKAMEKYRAENTSTSMKKGVFTSIFDNMTDGMKEMIEKSGTGDSADLYRNVKSNILLDFVTSKSSISDLDKELNEMNRKIDNLNILLDKKENSYYARFTSMEKYIQKMSSQSAWIGQQMM